MAYFEVEVSDSDIMDAGWVHEDDIDRDNKQQIIDSFKEAIAKIDHYYFKNNLTRDAVYQNIIDILEQTCGI
jgi:hypothetical protein